MPQEPNRDDCNTCERVGEINVSIEEGNGQIMSSEGEKLYERSKKGESGRERDPYAKGNGGIRGVGGKNCYERRASLEQTSPKLGDLESR